MTTVGFLEHWYAALRSQSGVRVRILEGEKPNAKAKLYKARKDALDPQLDALTITDSPTEPTELWIVHSPKVASSGT